MTASRPDAQREAGSAPGAEVASARVTSARVTSPVTAGLARVLDDLVRVPGTKYRVGVDPLIGCVPGVGDAVGTVVAGIVMVEAVRNRVPVRILFRIGWNYLIDAVMGTIPFVGDVADIAHKATSKNLRLVNQTIVDGKTIDTTVRGYVLRAVGAVVLMLLILIGMAGLAIWGLLKLIGVF